VTTSPTSEPGRIEPPRKPKTWRDHLLAGLKWVGLVIFCAYLWHSFVRTEFNMYTLVEGFPDIKRVMSELMHPDFSWYQYEKELVPLTDDSGEPRLNSRGEPLMKVEIRRGPDGRPVIKRDSDGDPKLGTLPVLLDSMNETVQISLVGTLLSVLLSFPLAFLAARNLMRGSPLGMFLYNLTRFVFNILRAFPPVILALLFVFMVGPGPFPGVLALALHSIGMLGKLFSEAIEQVDPAPIEAVRATGATRFLTVWFGILPQVVPLFISYSLYRWDINIRMSIILGIVGAGGIGFLIDQYIRQLQYSQASTSFLIILVAVTLLDYASAHFRERLG
jgi:phosphonate transport system permease protein